MNTKRTSTFSLSDEIVKKLDKISYTSRKSKSALVEEALELLFKTPKETK